MTETSETEAQTRTRSALGGFERDAKTFEGHLNRITASAEAFVKRCAKFAISDPDHPRLAETAELLAEAKRILGKSDPVPLGDAPGAYFEGARIEAPHGPETDEQRAARLANGEPLRGPETWQLADAIRGLVDRVRVVEQRTKSIVGHMGGDLAMIDGDGATGMDPSAAERIAALPNASISASFAPDPTETGIADGIDTTAPEPVSPLAKLAPDAAARVQAAIDAAAQKRAAELAAEAASSIPVSTEPIMPNPFAAMTPVAVVTAPNGSPTLVNPFAGLTP